MDEHCLFELMTRGAITRGSYEKPFCQWLDQLLDCGLVKEDPETGLFFPTGSAYCMKIVWNSGAIVLWRYAEEIRELIDGLVERGILGYCDGLFSQDEARYLNYMLNDSEATNSLGLRNKYAHANGPVGDPNSDELRKDYHTMLALLISITLKINEELMRATGKGGLDPDGLEDWPLYDASGYAVAKGLGVREMCR